MVKLHGFWRSIASYRVRVALNLKGVAYEEVEVDLLAGAQHAPAFKALNPHAAVPALEIDGRVLTQSLPILEFLDARFPDAPLFPADPFERARATATALVTIADSHPLIVPRVRGYLKERLGASDEAVHAFIVHWLGRGFETFEATLAERPPAPYAAGAAPGIADVAIASHCVAGALFGMDAALHPRTRALMERLDELDAVRSAHPLARKAAVERGG